jgi:6-pyruvoyltetrahydropterin/6-carboxytetrahydropterin synthase
MLMLSIKLNDFAAAHRLICGYQGKCSNLHGHNYSVTVRITSEKLSEHGFIADITQIKKLLNEWLEQHIDHSVIVSEADETLLTFLKQDNQKYYLLPKGENTTLEYLSQHLYHVFTTLLASHPIELKTIIISENESSQAIYEND